MAIITNILADCDPVTFDGPADVGTVHRYANGNPRSWATDCGLTLAYDHGVVGPASTKPLCTECWS